MARTALTVSDSATTGLDLTNKFTAVDNTTNAMFPNDGKTVLIIKNSGGTDATVTIISVPDPYGRTKDEVITVPAGGEVLTGTFKPFLFNQTSNDKGNIYVDVSAAVSIAAVRIK